MSGSIPPYGPLAYEGAVAVPYIIKDFAPLSSFNTFPVPSIWVDPTHGTSYILVSKALGVANWLPLGGAAGTVASITTPDSTVVLPTAGTIDFVNGTGANITGSGNAVTFNFTGGGLNWSLVSGATQAMTPNCGYVSDNGGGVTYTLPASCPFGAVMCVTTISTGGFTILQNAGQQVLLGKRHTSVGVGGSLASTAIGNTIGLLCTVADTNFIVISSVGNITYV